jgi:hypothetical protein
MSTRRFTRARQTAVVATVVGTAAAATIAGAPGAAGAPSTSGFVTSNVPVIEEIPLDGGNLVAVELSNGTRVMAPGGSCIHAYGEVDAVEDGQEGQATGVEVRPGPIELLDEAKRAQLDASPVSADEAIRMAVEQGVIPADVAASWNRQQDTEAAFDATLTPSARAEQVSTLSVTNGNGGYEMETLCNGAENRTGKIYGCATRYRSHSDSNVFGVRHHATAEAKGPWFLIRARSGAYDNTGTGELRQWSPAQDDNRECGSANFGGSYRGLELKITTPVCSAAVGPEVERQYVKARWRGGTYGAREASGTHWVYRPPGTQSGYTMHLHFFAV